MSPAPIIIEPDSSVEEAARLMLTHHIGCLPVMRGETLVGIITTSDLVIALINLLHDRQPTATNIT
jgi:CBS domain-containing protein